MERSKRKVERKKSKKINNKQIKKRKKERNGRKKMECGDEMYMPIYTSIDI